MGDYTYLVAQLPYLVYGQNPPMSSAAFKEYAKPMLEDEDAKLLDKITLDPTPAAGDQAVAEKTGCEFIDSWNAWELALRLNLARRRSIKIKRDAAPEPPPFPQDAVAAAGRAVGIESPLEGEIALDKSRWSAIESFQGYDYFNRNVVFAFLLKLLLLERRHSFNTEEGFTEYKSLYASILEDVQESVGEPK